MPAMTIELTGVPQRGAATPGKAISDVGPSREYRPSAAELESGVEFIDRALDAAENESFDKRID